MKTEKQVKRKLEDLKKEWVKSEVNSNQRKKINRGVEMLEWVLQ
ncbi:MAG: hypothetical protein ACTSR8_22385 [Promethearchaeota archaeon]